MAEETRILIVDDQPVNRMVLGAMLERLGAVVMEADDGVSALEALAVQAFDLAMFDIHMPGMTGIELLSRLRAAGGPNAGIPVVAVTGDTTRDERGYVALGFADCAFKPISLAHLKRVLETARSALPADIRNSAAA